MKYNMLGATIACTFMYTVLGYPLEVVVFVWAAGVVLIEFIFGE